MNNKFVSLRKTTLYDILENYTNRYCDMIQLFNPDVQKAFQNKCLQKFIDQAYYFDHDKMQKLRGRFDSKQVATFLAKFAKAYATQHPDLLSPFWLNLQRAMNWQAPYPATTKDDDITVVVGFIVSTELDQGTAESYCQNSKKLQFDLKDASALVFTLIVNFFHYLLY